MKICTGCGEQKDPSEFYANRGMASGFLSKCKPCVRAQVRLRRRENPAVQAYDRERAKLPHRRAHATANTKRYRTENPEAYRAHSAVNNAVRDGRLVRADRCEAEGCDVAAGLHAHHDDYSRPLDVRWLCPVHHHRGHHDAEE